MLIKMSNNKRSNLIMKNVVASFFIKGWSALVTLLMVPLALKMLGVYSNGVWLTISGILLWIDMFDIGLGNGLRNVVANNIATGNTTKVREAISSTFFMLAAIIVPIFILLCFIILAFDMHEALGVDKHIIGQLDTILIIAIALSCCTFVLKSTGNFFMGMQLPAVNNLIVSLGQTLALALTFAAYLLGHHSLMTVVIANISAPLIIWLLCLPYTFIIKYPQFCPSIRLINIQMARNLCSTGVQFFLLQICSVILFTSTNIIISKAFSPAEVTPYQIAYRYFSVMLTVVNIVYMPFWNATTDAYSRGDISWIRKTSRKLDLMMGLIFLALTLMVVVSEPVYHLWIGRGVHFPLDLSVSMAVYIFTIIASLRYSYILNGINVLRIQMIFTSIATIVFIPLAWMACKLYGTVTSLVIVMCIVNIPGLIANAWKCQQIFKMPTCK